MLTWSRRRQSARWDPATSLPHQDRSQTVNTHEGLNAQEGSQRRGKIQRIDEICQFMAKKICIGGIIQIYATTQGFVGLGGHPATRVKRPADPLLYIPISISCANASVLSVLPLMKTDLAPGSLWIWI